MFLFFPLKKFLRYYTTTTVQREPNTKKSDFLELFATIDKYRFLPSIFSSEIVFPNLKKPSEKKLDVNLL